jgi:polyvinyl alcohol dehydrogenase (cytochrome)
MRNSLTMTVISAALVALPVAAEQIHPGQALYEQKCQTCHGGRVSKAPQVSLLQIMSPGTIYRAITAGVMREQAAGLDHTERQAIAEYLTGQSLDDTAAAALPPACEGDAARFDLQQPPNSQGWGNGTHNRRHYGAGQTSINAGNLDRLQLKWAFAYPEAVRARSQPAIVGGAVVVGSQSGAVYALDQESGCLRWTFNASAEVRTAIVPSPWAAGDDASPMLYFGDLVGNIYAIDAITGELAWRDRPDDHPSLTLTAAPVLEGGRLYVPLSSLEVTAAADPTYPCCTFRGGIAVYDARSGEKLWTAYTIDQPPAEVSKNSVGTPVIAPSGAPIWNTPAIDRKRGVMYAGTGENYSSPANDTSDAIMAFDLEDGRIRWHQQMTPGDAWNMGCETEEKINCPAEDGPDYDFGAAVIVATTSGGRDVLIAGQKSGDVYGLDPDNNGKILWHQKLGRGGIQGGVHFGMTTDGDTVYVPMSDFDGGARWPGKAYPGMFALDVGTGKVKWYTPTVDQCNGREFCQPGLSAAASSVNGGVMGGAMDGVMRFYAADSGQVSWQFDADRDFDTVNGVTASGGSFGGATGPVFSGNKLFMNAGYGIYFHMPGNVLLVFELAENESGEQGEP